MLTSGTGWRRQQWQTPQQQLLRYFTACIHLCFLHHVGLLEFVNFIGQFIYLIYFIVIVVFKCYIFSIFIWQNVIFSTLSVVLNGGMNYSEQMFSGSQLGTMWQYHNFTQIFSTVKLVLKIFLKWHLLLPYFWSKHSVVSTCSLPTKSSPPQVQTHD